MANRVNAMHGSDNAVTLRLKGENADEGIEIVDLERFLSEFVSALRGFDRVRRSQPAVRGGAPARREAEVTAFRVVGLKKGSTVLTLVPRSEEADDEDALFDSDESIALDNLQALSRGFSEARDFDSDVADALSKARTVLGHESGAIEIGFPKRLAVPSLTVDKDTLDRVRAEQSDPQRVTRVSGRLHLIDVEPDRIAVRSPQGIDWTCRYEEALEPSVMALVGKIVIVEGEGVVRSPRTGAMKVESIRLAYAHDQPALFTPDAVSDPDALMETQAIDQPQGLAGLGDPEWQDDDEGDRFLDYILDRS